MLAEEVIKVGSELLVPAGRVVASNEAISIMSLVTPQLRLIGLVALAGSAMSSLYSDSPDKEISVPMVPDSKNLLASRMFVKYEEGQSYTPDLTVQPRPIHDVSDEEKAFNYLESNSNTQTFTSDLSDFILDDIANSIRDFKILNNFSDTSKPDLTPLKQDLNNHLKKSSTIQKAKNSEKKLSSIDLAKKTADNSERTAAAAEKTANATDNNCQCENLSQIASQTTRIADSFSNASSNPSIPNPNQSITKADLEEVLTNVFTKFFTKKLDKTKHFEDKETLGEKSFIIQNVFSDDFQGELVDE